MRHECCPSYPVSIFVAGDYAEARAICRAFCDEEGLCVTVTPTLYVYTNGEEAGVVVGLINYPRFPSTPSDILTTAKLLALELMSKLEQESVSVQTPDETHWFSIRAPDLASVDGRRMAETENTDSVPQGTTSAVAATSGETPTPGPAIDQDGGWQPIETAPPPPTEILLYWPAIPEEDLPAHMAVCDHRGGPFRHPTHWMLPDPPHPTWSFPMTESRQSAGVDAPLVPNAHLRLEELRQATVALIIAAEKDSVADWPGGVDYGDLDKTWAAVDATYPTLWTPEQVEKLNEWQECGHVHPFTCPNRSDPWHKNEDGEELNLEAIPQGWVCRSCGYRQFWAHDFMFEGAPPVPFAGPQDDAPVQP